MSEKRTRLSYGDKMAILEANKIPGYKKEEIMKQYKIGKTAELDVGFREPYSTGMTGLKCSRLGPVKNNTTVSRVYM